MKKQTIALHFRRFNYTALYIFGQTIHDNVQNNALLYPSPLPPLSVLQSSINKVSGLVEKWGDRRNHGTTAVKLALIAARDVLRGHISSYARYVMSAQPDNYTSWAELGFTLKKLPAKTGRMTPVQNFHQFISRNIPQGKIKLKWKRPLDTPPATMITYIVLRSEDEHFANAVIVGYTMNKATFMDTPPKAGILYRYWVIPVTAAGEGALSEMCSAFASPV